MTRRAHLLLRLCVLSLMLTPPLAVRVQHPVAEGKTWVGLMLVLPALWAGLALAFASRDAWSRARSTLLPLLSIHAAIGISTLAATDLPTALERWTELAAWSALVPLVAMLGIEHRWPRRLVGMAVLTVIAAAAQTLASASAIAGLAHIEGGMFGNRNQLGQFLALGGFPLLAWTLTRRGALLRVISLVVGALFLAAVLVTRSKAAWISLPIAITLAVSLVRILHIPWPRLSRPQRNWGGIVLLAALLGGGSIALALGLRHPDLVTHELQTLEFDSQSVGVRLGLWERSLEILWDNPITGCGIGQWPLAVAPLIGEEHFRLESTRPREAHCDLLQWAAETGAVGILALFALLLWAVVAARGALREPSLELWAGLLTLLALGTLILVDFPIQRAVPTIIGAIWLGTLAGAAPLRASPSSVSRPLAIGLGTVLAALTIGSAPHLGRHLARDYHLGLVRAALAGQGQLGPEELKFSIERSCALGASPLWADLLGLAAIQAGHPDVAGQVLSEACDRDPGWFEHWRLLALAWADLDDPEAALTAARRAVELAPGLAAPWMTLERVAWETGDREVALEAVDRALAIDPSTPRALRERALLLQELQRFAESAAAAASHLAVQPDDALLWQVLGLSLNQMNRSEEARDALRRAIELDESLVNAWHILATIHIHRWEGEEAERCARRALDLDPSDPLIWDVLAFALSLQWRTEEAHRALDRALELDPSCATAWRTRGLILNQEGHLREGAEALVQSWRLNPADPLTRQLLLEMGAQLPDETQE